MIMSEKRPTKHVKDLRVCGYCQGSGLDPLIEKDSTLRKECSVCQGEGVVRWDKNKGEQDVR